MTSNQKKPAYFLGVDVGVKNSTIAVLQGNRVVEVCSLPVDFTLDFAPDSAAVGIDAPLSFPEKGYFRECERKLLKMGIRLFPSGAEFFRKVVERGMEFAKFFKERGFEVFEVYPYATRVALGIAPREKKSRKKGLRRIKTALASFVEGDLEPLDHDGVDAVLSALTVKLYYDRIATLVEGRDGSILVPFTPLNRFTSDFP